MSSAGFPGSRFTCISELGGAEDGEKVRFVGCITAYDPQTAIISLNHRYTLEKRRAGQTTILSYDVDVDASLVLGTATFNQTHLRGREWVDVVGYVRKDAESRTTSVQAVHLQSVGQVFDLARYERTIEGRIEMS